MQAPQAPQGAPVTQAPARATQLHQPPPSGTSGAGPSGAAAAASAPAPRSELDELLEDREFLDFYQDLNDYLPTIPDTFTKNHLARCGFQTTDTRVVRLISLAAQTFIKHLAQDAFDAARERKKREEKQQKSRAGKAKDKRFVLTVEDLEGPLAKAGARKREVGPKAGGPAAAGRPARADEGAPGGLFGEGAAPAALAGGAGAAGGPLPS